MTTAAASVSVYCERVDAGFWAEPVNALTNAAFLVAALFVASTLRRRDFSFSVAWDLWLLSGLTVCIGVGSFLWHTLASPWSAWADILPILLFISLFLWSFLVRVTHFPWWGALAGFVLFHVVNFTVQSALPGDFLNGSVFYLPAWLGFLILSILAVRVRYPGGHLILAAFLVFSLSITLRTVDREVCDALSIGTHFAWHLFNALTLYLATIGLSGQTPARTRS